MNNLLLFGDLAIPNQHCADAFNQSVANLNFFQNGFSIGNLEGMIAKDPNLLEQRVLFNHPSVIYSLKQINAVSVGLANNHSLDLPYHYKSTISILKKNQIGSSGIGFTQEDAHKPHRFLISGTHFTVFSFCWPVIMQHQKNPKKGVYVAPLRENRILELIKHEKINFPESKIICLLHWNFDFENLPFPSHRIFARALIDQGVSIVLGSHSHVVQGAELYNDSLIIYGLGNFYVPSGFYMNGRVTYPAKSKLTLVIEWNYETNSFKNHWLKYKTQDHTIVHVSSNKFVNDSFMKDYTPYVHMSDKEYITYYKKNRQKGDLIPVYTNYDQFFKNMIFDTYLKSRIKLARFLDSVDIRKGKRY